MQSIMPSRKLGAKSGVMSVVTQAEISDEPSTKFQLFGIAPPGSRRGSDYLPKYRPSSDLHSALAVILINARSIGFFSGLCSGSAIAI